jgi:hypothetical protein
MEDTISVRLFTGPVPRQGTAVLHLGFSPAVPPLDAARLAVRLNTVPLEATVANVPSAVEANVIDWCTPLKGIGQILRYAIPLTSVLPDANLVELLPPKVAGELLWAEISIQP